MGFSSSFPTQREIELSLPISVSFEKDGGGKIAGQSWRLWISIPGFEPRPSPYDYIKSGKQYFLVTFLMPNASVTAKKDTSDKEYMRAVLRTKYPVQQDVYRTVPFENTEPQEQKHPHYDASQANGCMVCKLVDGTVPTRVVHENDDFIAVLDVMPKAIGHVTVLCRRHNEGFESMTDIERSTYADFIAEVASRMKSRLGATGYVVVSPVCNSEGHETGHFMSHIMPVYGKAQEIPVMSLIPNQSVPEFVMEDVKKKLTSVKGIAHENQARRQARYFS